MGARRTQLLASGRAFLRGPVGTLVVAIDFFLLVLALVAAVNQTHNAWMLGCIAALLLTGLAFWRYHEMRIQLQTAGSQAGSVDLTLDGANLSMLSDLIGAAITRGEGLVSSDSDEVVLAWSSDVEQMLTQSLGQGSAAAYASNAGITTYGDGSPKSNRQNFVRSRVQRLVELQARLESGGVNVRSGFDPDRWTRPASVAVVGDLEQVPWQVVVNGTPYVHSSVLWIEVTNNGPTSTFTARAPRITGVPWGENYRLIQPAWEQGPSQEVQIPHGGTARLKLAGILESPRAFWFYTSQVGEIQAGNQWSLGDGTADIGLLVEIVNTGDSDRVLRAAGRIVIPEDVKAATFSLQVLAGAV